VLHVLNQIDMQSFVPGRRKLERMIEKAEGFEIPSSLSWGDRNNPQLLPSRQNCLSDFNENSNWQPGWRRKL